MNFIKENIREHATRLLQQLRFQLRHVIVETIVLVDVTRPETKPHSPHSHRHVCIALFYSQRAERSVPHSEDEFIRFVHFPDSNNLKEFSSYTFMNSHGYNLNVATWECTVYSWYPNLADEIEGLAVPLESSQSMALNFSARSNLDLFIVEHDVRVPLPPLQLNNLRNPPTCHVHIERSSVAHPSTHPVLLGVREFREVDRGRTERSDVVVNLAAECENRRS